MKMDLVAGSGNDEFYTPEYAIAPIVKYLKMGGVSAFGVLLTPNRAIS